MAGQDRTYADAIAEIARQAQPTIHEIDGTKVLVFGDGTVQSLAAYQRRPLDITAARTAETEADFIAMVKADAITGSRIYVDGVGLRAVAVIDAHQTDSPGREKHTINYGMSLSPEAKAWKDAANAGWLTHEDFASFIDERSADVTNPSQAEIVTIANNLSAKIGAEVDSKISHSGGSVSLKTTDEVRGKTEQGEVEIPKKIEIAVPLFRGDEMAERLDVRIEVRVRNNSIVGRFRIPLLDQAIEHRVTRLVKSVSEGTYLPTFRGKP